MACFQVTPKGPSLDLQFVTVADRRFLLPSISHEGFFYLSHMFPFIGPVPWQNQRF